MNKKVIIKFDKDAYEEYKKLQEFIIEEKSSKGKPTYSQLLSSINIALRNIKANFRYGDLIPKKYISKEVIKKYGTDKILRVELVGFWRLFYIITSNEVEIIAFILDFMDHKKYNKLFGYKKK